MLGFISNIVTLISFVVSVGTFLLSHSILKNMDAQRREYEQERFDLQTSLIALRENIWEDDLLNLQIRSQLRTSILTYRQKYWKISHPLCLFHVRRSIKYLRDEKNATHKKEKLCASIDYLIARFNKKEDLGHD